jgi:[acyl-carrier-protein] S-malonyltransferase/trans-AT polyketide synthase/acyltransferase/oxidoreductase domain-containing protein
VKKILSNERIAEKRIITMTQTTGAVFPGQGTQWHGMGRDFFDHYKEAKQTFEEASDCLGWDVASLCFGEDPRLHLTEFAQPCILTTEIAMYRSITAHHGFHADCFGGHSLGEYSALTAAGVMDLGDAVRIVHERGKLMQNACPEGTGGMAAVISETLDLDDVNHAITGMDVDIANINSASQIVLSGGVEGLKAAESRLKESATGSDGFRFVPLTVSAAFHSRFMAGVAHTFRRILDGFADRFDFSRSAVVTSNYDGGFHRETDADVLDSLSCQIVSPVRWRDNMDTLASRTTDIFEIGPSRPLRSFFKSQGIACRSLTSVGSVERQFG